MRTQNKHIINTILLILIFTISMIPFVSAQSGSSKTTIYFFWGDGCPHCANEKPFLEGLEQKYPEIEIKMFETWKNPENAKLFQEVAQAYGTTAQGVPTTFIGDDFWIGFADYMKDEIETKIKECIKEGCEDLTEQIVSPNSPVTTQAPIPQDVISDNATEVTSPTTTSSPATIISSLTTQDESLCIHVFLDSDCGECQEVKSYIYSLESKGVNFVIHNVNNNTEKEIYESFKETYGLKSAGYPSIFIGDSYFIGVNSIKNNLENEIEKCQDKEECPCPAGNIKGLSPSIPKNDFKPEKTEVLTIPLVGTVDLGKMPLVVMTGLIAFVDGFNPCSLWVLTFLLGIVIYTGSRKKIFLVGLTFLLVTATAYGLFMLGLLNVFTYVGYTMWIKIGVALIATIFALVNIKDYFWYKKGISFTISDKYKPKLFKKVRNIMDPNKSTASMLLATAAMALGIVLVELPCTAGFPMIWTNIISQHNVTGVLFALLFIMYMFIYLIDEIVVFTGVTITLKASRFQEKHGRILKLIGGMIMLALAIALVFFSELMNSIQGSLLVFGSAVLFSYLIIVIHRKILPMYGIKIGTEAIERKTLDKKEDTEKTDDETKEHDDKDHKEKKEKEREVMKDEC